MLSKNQIEEKKQKVKYFVDLFLNSNKSINELARETHSSSSSIQRYLKDEAYIKDIYGVDAKSIILKIERKLLKNLQDGKSKGGRIYYINNEAIKDVNGHFIGSRKR